MLKGPFYSIIDVQVKTTGCYRWFLDQHQSGIIRYFSWTIGSMMVASTLAWNVFNVAVLLRLFLAPKHRRCYNSFHQYMLVCVTANLFHVITSLIPLFLMDSFGIQTSTTSNIHCYLLENGSVYCWCIWHIIFTVMEVSRVFETFSTRWFSTITRRLPLLTILLSLTLSVMITVPLIPAQETSYRQEILIESNNNVFVYYIDRVQRVANVTVCATGIVGTNVKNFLLLLISCITPTVFLASSMCSSYFAYRLENKRRNQHAATTSFHYHDHHYHDGGNVSVAAIVVSRGHRILYHQLAISVVLTASSLSLLYPKLAIVTSNTERRCTVMKTLLDASRYCVYAVPTLCTLLMSMQAGCYQKLLCDSLTEATCTVFDAHRRNTASAQQPIDASALTI